MVDALSVAAANELVTAAEQDGWTDVALDGSQRPAALAALPTLTQRSRCSLLCGELRQGDDAVERAGFLATIRDEQLEATGGVPDPIFHKRALDSIRDGASIATDVNNAIADTERQRLVAAVLNYVDDTLHHTDPGGTEWNLQTITHLRALLHAAKNAGRVVIITSDHGHIIEHGDSTKVTRAHTYGLRAHGDYANVEPDREVFVEGPRVLTEGHKVVLAVDERIRYGARNAGYHGGGSPAEVVVPVVTLVAGQLLPGLQPVVHAEPDWWHASAPVILTSAPARALPRRKHAKTTLQREPALFDAAELHTTATPTTSALASKVLKTTTFDAQLALAGRIVVQKHQIKNLLQVLVDTPAHEITIARAAAVLGVATGSANGALMQAKRILDVEGYEVLHVGAGVVRLNVAALQEQFGVRE